MTAIRVSNFWLIGALIAALGGCVAVGEGYGGGPYYGPPATVEYGVDFYEPSGFDYGGLWRPGYHVGPPPRGGFERGGHPDSHDSHPAFHPAPAGRPIPSIPTQPRGGGSRGGGESHGGGRHR